MQKARVIIVPGNGGAQPTDNWFPYLKEELEKAGIPVVATEFPDSHLAREAYWIPFLAKELKADKNTVLVGHSSGAIAAMRFAEKNKILGSVLIGGYYTDLGMESEKQSGYFDRPWKWEDIKKNQQWIVQFSSTDDRWIPINEPRHVHEMLGSDYYEFQDQGHFGGDYYKETFPELLEVLQGKFGWGAFPFSG